MVDVHILTRPNDNQDWFNECLKSLEDENINLFIEPGIEENTGLARYNAFKKGTSKYVAYVDPDDLIIPGIFSIIMENMTNEYCGIFTEEIKIDKSGEKIGGDYKYFNTWKRFGFNESTYPHQLCVMRRDLVDKYLDEFLKWNYRSEYIIKNMITLDAPWKQLDVVGYKWRIHDNNTHNTNIEYSIKAKNYIRQKFMERL